MAPKYVKIFGKNHSKCMTDFIQDSWKKECFSNVTFICKGDSGSSRRALFANKAVLAAGSKTLYQLLSDTGDDEDTTIFVPESDYHTIKMLLQYIYTGQVLVNSILDELQSLILDWEVEYPQVDSVSAARKSNPKSSLNEDPLSLDTFVHNGSYAEDGDYDDAAPGFDSSIEEHPLPLSAPVNENQTGITRKKKTVEETSKGGTGNHGPVEKKKRVRRKRNLDDLKPDSDAEDDTEEDKADLLLSQAFLKKEKTRTLQLNSTVIELRRTRQRHELYMQHFYGVNPQCLPYNKAKRTPVKTKRIPCNICGKDFDSLYMKFHIESMHSDGARSYLCEQCGDSFTLKNNLNAHVRRVHGTGERPHICTFCNKGFKDRAGLKGHMTIHTGERPFQCPYCDKNFRTSMVLVKHKRIHTGETPYGPCKFCGARFKYQYSYAMHLRAHKGEQRRRRSRNVENTDSGTIVSYDPVTMMRKCSTCGHTFSREYPFLIHEAAHRKEDPKLPCRHCPNTYPSMKLLKEHSKTEHLDKYHQCDQCPKVFTNKNNLDDHLLSHSNQGEKFCCEECGKEFLTKLKLKNHVLWHSSKHAFQCQHCPKKFKARTLLVEHERIHTGERPFVCSHCPKAFRLKPHLENHIRIHTGEKPFVCIHCGKAFTAQHSMIVHVRLHTGKKFQCSICVETFRSLVKLKEHEKTHNDGEEEIRDSDSRNSDEASTVSDNEEGDE